MKRDNLQFQAMAKFKALRDGDTLGFEAIEKNLKTKASYKGLALSDSSIELYERTKVARKRDAKRFGIAVDRSSDTSLDGRKDVDLIRRLKQ